MTNFLSPALYADESACVHKLLSHLPWPDSFSARVEERTTDLITRTRARGRKIGELESFLQEYSLSSEEGLSLMALAEALLRIPDAPTADALITDKVTAANWFSTIDKRGDWSVKATGLGLAVTRKTLESLVAGLGKPAIRQALKSAMRIMGKQFVLGRTIDEATHRAKPYRKGGYRPSYDMLGEGARTHEDAERYFESYREAIKYVGEHIKWAAGTRPGLSVKLSALHPRYEYSQREACVPAITEKLQELCRLAASYDLGLTIDAEESDRLVLSLEIIRPMIADPITHGWTRFGLAIQAYDRRAFDLIDYIEDLAHTHARHVGIRLVKGAYWDTEIKRAQLMGVESYPVFTRKANTDLSWLACAHKLLQKREWLYPMFATHNAHSIAAVLEMAEDNNQGFEFQRLHGMGETLHDLMIKDNRVISGLYAPVGPHEELLPYLVRRLLENGANSSFLHQLHNPDITPAALAEDPIAPLWQRSDAEHSHAHIPQPPALYGLTRKNAAGLDLHDGQTLRDLLSGIEKRAFTPSFEAAPFINGKVQVEDNPHDITNPADRGDVIGKVWPTALQQIDPAFTTATEGFRQWQATPAAQRAAALERLADLLEQHQHLLVGLLIREAGRTIPDSVSELREAVDFCRYYAAQGRPLFDEKGVQLDGPTGERNILTLGGRGVFVCISPWNFPLAIFLGQITAALMAGNAVIAKPAEQTPLIAMAVARLILKAGVPPRAFTLMPGAGDIGAALVNHPAVAGVAFTGSTAVARKINQALAAKDGPIVPLIAETGGQNAMIVDSSALPEQVVDDVILSAFGSAGQRCSALRVLYLQDDIADKTITMLKGAMATRTVGRPSNLATDIGPVIDEEARAKLEAHRKYLDSKGTPLATINHNSDHVGTFFTPCAYEIDSLSLLSEEIFGPILHIIRYKSRDLDWVIEEINATGYGLTFGLHSRINARAANLSDTIRAGNCYVNRGMIGAVVGCQPFGGNGLSGTGPKAGGPHYLPRFTTEKVTSTDTTRQGGNATLISLQDK